MQNGIYLTFISFESLLLVMFLYAMQTVENMIESMLKDYFRVLEENHHLNEELQNCTENENGKLKEENHLNDSGEESATTIDSQNDCCVEIEELQKQLAAKDETIEQLMAKFEYLKSESTVREKSEPSAKQFNQNLSEASLNLKNKLHDLGQINTDIADIFNKKQNQLLEQQAQIDELIKLLESQSESSNAANGENCMNKIKELEERDQILAQHAAIYDEQITILLNERKNLMEINNDLTKRISICQSELCKYNFE